MKHFLILLITVSSAFGFTTSNPTPPVETVQWLTFEEAVERNKTEPRIIVMDMYTDWCGWCKKMDASTFNHAVIAKYMNENFYPIKFDAEQKNDIEFGGRTYKYVANGRRGYHEMAAELMGGKMSYPTVVLLNSDFQIMQTMPGYRDAKEFEKIIKFFGSGAYKDIEWATYQEDASQFEIQE